LSRARVLIGIPLLEFMYSRFFSGWLKMRLGGSEVIDVSGAYIYDAHNGIISEALKRPHWEYLLFLEQDHLYPPNLVERVSNYSEPIIGAPYFLRHPPHPCCVLVPKDEIAEDPRAWVGDWRYGDARFLKPSEAVDLIRQGKLQRVLGVGMGCTAIRRDVLEGWPKDEPIFQAPIEGGHIFTDDVWFCRRASQLGYAIFADGGLAIPHIGPQLVGLETHLEAIERIAREQGMMLDRVATAAERDQVLGHVE
jgi:hypothetical protein